LQPSPATRSSTRSPFIGLRRAVKQSNQRSNNLFRLLLSQAVFLFLSSCDIIFLCNLDDRSCQLSGVRTVTTRTWPSSPGCTRAIRAKGQCVGGVVSCFSKRRRPSFKLSLMVYHGRGSFGHGSIGHHQPQRPVPRDFLLFKRCEWLVFNRFTSKRRLSVYHLARGVSSWRYSFDPCHRWSLICCNNLQRLS